MLLENKIANHNEILGFSESEVELCEKNIGAVLPKNYKEFLLAIGHDAGHLFQGTHILFREVDSLLELRSDAEELLKENDEDFLLPKDAFVFSMHQGYEFNYFILSESDDPSVYQYVEGDGTPRVVWESFSSFLYRSINSCSQAIRDGIIPL